MSHMNLLLSKHGPNTHFLTNQYSLVTQEVVYTQLHSFSNHITASSTAPRLFVASQS
jgi:hypothetical protein